jgi:KipI family sensor histidine kinase inhibitor
VAKQEDPYRELARGARPVAAAGSGGFAAIGRHRAIIRGALGAHTIESPSPISSQEDGIVRTLAVGREALLVEVGSPQQAVALATWGRDRGLARDVVPGAETVLFDGVSDAAHLAEALADWRQGETPVGPALEIAVTYDGPDLHSVAEQWHCSVDEVVARHLRTDFVSAFCGFAPGFAYLSGLDDEVARLATPRTRVPAGSVALAGRWCGVYPRESPGGWQVIGRTDAVLWDAERAEPALLAPGVRVRFRDASHGPATQSADGR